MTATQPDSRPKLTRRGVMKTTAVGIGSAATLGVAGTGNARAVAPAVLGVGAAGAAALGYLINEGVDKFLGSSKDLSGFTGADALKAQIKEEVLQMKSADERVMTSIENNLANSETVALAKAKAAAIEKMNAEEPESEAVNAVDTAVNAYYATIEKNILTHYAAQARQVADQIIQIEANDGLDLDSTLNFKGPDWLTRGLENEGTKTITLLDDTQIDIPKIVLLANAPNEAGDPTHSLTINGESGNRMQFNVPDGDNITYLDSRVFESTLSAAQSRADTVKTKMGGFVTDLYQEYGAGDIPTEDVVDPITAATELGTSTGLSSREAAAGIMGIPTSAGFSLRLRIRDDNGKTTEVDAELYTNAKPADSGFQVGQTYDPSNFSDPIYISYEYVDPATGERSTDFTQVENPFTVIEATDEEGNSVDNVEPTERVTQTADVSKLEEQLAQLREEQVRLQEKAEEEQSSGGAGAGFFSEAGPNTGILAAAVGALAIAFGLSQGGQN